jgi:very-short-patch-repair endonuclease
LTRVERAGSQGLAEVVEAQAALMRQAELPASLSQQRTYLATFPQSEAASVLLQAQDEWNSEIYEEVSRQLARLEGMGDTYQMRRALLARIENAAPAWARAIAQRQGGHGSAQPLGDSTAAWRWRQWHQELERRASVSITDLQERLNATQDELRSLAAQIIEHETWAAQRERTALQSQQALMGYVQTIRKVGKGTGKRVPELLRQARQLLASARRAVPVWVMPLSRVYESFDPRETRFDVVIIDEASQSDVTALAALYFGREHVVVGDKEQVTPDAVGQRLDQVQRLIDTNLQGIPNSHLYDGQTSIYDLAETAFGGVVALREHFRCVPEIIQFSNDLSYNLTIRPLREPMSASVRPALIAHRVHGFRDSNGKTNQVEAEEIASLVVTCLSDPAYALNESGQPTTFGVISLLGVEQALLIEELMRQRLSPSTFAKHRLLCGNAAQFQGDERDVVFLSMVDGPPDDGQLPNRDEGPRGLYKKRYNVAVSRARNQLWVVHSLDPSAHLKPRDLRRRLIEHARDPQALLRAMEVQGKRTDSIFERLVLQRLLAARYRVETQWPVGAYRIDLVVEGKTRRLAVECDGEKWHTAEQLQHDIDREAVLQRLGWKFVRIRGSVFFRDPDAAMAPVFVKLDQLGIEPLGEGVAAPDPGGVVERVRRQAETLRAQWHREKTDAAGVELG